MPRCMSQAWRAAIEGAEAGQEAAQDPWQHSLVRLVETDT